MCTRKSEERAFTLIELLVVIAITSLLSSVVLASVSNARQQAKYTKAEQKMNQIKNVIIRAQGNEGGKDLLEIINSSCTRCDGNCVSSPLSSQCKSEHRDALNKIYNAANEPQNTLDALLVDPWGTPYMLDENEGEFASNPCRKDTLTTYGPDQSRGGGDDVAVEIPFGGTCL